MSALKAKEDGTIVFLVHMTLKPGQDDELIELVKNAPKRLLAEKIRETMRIGIRMRTSTTTRNQ